MSEDHPKPPDSFSETVEHSLNTVAGVVVRFAKTYRTLLVGRSSKVDVLLMSREQDQSLPPLTFLILAYLLATGAASVIVHLLGPLFTPEFLQQFRLEKLDHLRDVSLSPAALIEVALPLVVVILAAALASSALLGIDLSLMFASIGYSTGLLLVSATLIASTGFVMIAVGVTLEDWGGLLILPLAIVLLVLLILPVLSAMRLLARCVIAAVAMRPGRRPKRFTGTGLVVTTVSLWAATATLVSHALDVEIFHRMRAEVTIQEIKLGSGESMVAGDLRVDSDTVWVPGGGALKEPGSLPIQILVLLRNRSDEPLVLARKQTWEGRGHWMRIGHRGWQRGSRTAALDDPQNVELVATAWSDGDSPTLVLKKGDLKWLWLSGAIKGLCGAVGFNGLFLKVEIEEESTLTILRSPWYEGVYNPRSDTIRSDTIRSDTIRSDSTMQRDTASVTDPCR